MKACMTCKHFGGLATGWCLHPKLSINNPVTGGKDPVPAILTRNNALPAFADDWCGLSAKYHELKDAP